MSVSLHNIFVVAFAMFNGCYEVRFKRLHVSWSDCDGYDRLIIMFVVCAPRNLTLKCYSCKFLFVHFIDPIDTVKVTQQSTKQNLPLKQTIESIYKSAGNNVGRFFKGAAGYAALDGFSAAIFFAVYEEMKFLAAKSLSGAALGLSAYPSAGTLSFNYFEKLLSKFFLYYLNSCSDCIFRVHDFLSAS